jgi:SAM-dependent methyltransferase
MFVINEDTLWRYRDNYGLGKEVGIDEVKRHVELEAKLTNKLRVSSVETRWRIFDECYTTLYRELPWLNKTEDELAYPIAPDLLAWGHLVGPGAKTLFEIGSGKARLLNYLASLGHSCVATEITRERRAHLERHGLTWHLTDGIHLAQFEEPRRYDLVISTQVVEHLHPDDLLEHFINARTILKPGGEYLFDTPHRGAGPHDLSRVLNADHAVFMHLKEYTFIELRALLRTAGFRRIRAIYGAAQPRPSAVFLLYCLLWDRAFAALRIPCGIERKIRWSWKVRTRLRLPTDIWLSATA